MAVLSAAVAMKTVTIEVENRWFIMTSSVSAARGSAMKPSLRPVPCSEIRLRSARDVDVLLIKSMDVFSTDGFPQNRRSRYVGQGRGPRRGEGALVLDGQVQLQEFAAMPAEDVAGHQPILFFVPFDSVLHVVVVTQAKAFDDMQ